ncbi:hypothetical protein D3C81_960570 [compost metagenome]
MGHAHAGSLLELQPRHVRRTANAGRRVVEPARIGLRLGHERPDVRHTQVPVHGQDQRRDGQARNGGEILPLVTRLVEPLVDAIQRGRGQRQRIAIRRGAGQCSGSERAARAGLVIDHDGLAELFGQGFSEDACHVVGRAGRCVAHQHANGAIGVVVGRERGRHERYHQGRHRECAREYAPGAQASRDHHLSPFLFWLVSCGPSRRDIGIAKLGDAGIVVAQVAQDGVGMGTGIWRRAEEPLGVRRGGQVDRRAQQSQRP